MQYPPGISQPQLPLFDNILTQRLAPFGNPQPPGRTADQERLSELSFSGSSAHCQQLLAPILRELGDSADSRWLTLIAPPAFICQDWLRACGLNRERVILLQPRTTCSAVELACKALAAGCSHTVVSWLERPDRATRQRLQAAAKLGGTQSLNIRLGC